MKTYEELKDMKKEETFDKDRWAWANFAKRLYSIGRTEAADYFKAAANGELKPEFKKIAWVMRTLKMENA